MEGLHPTGRSEKQVASAMQSVANLQKQTTVFSEIFEPWLEEGIVRTESLQGWIEIKE